VDELLSGLWTWTGRHPAWQAERDTLWGPDVRSYAVVRDDHALLFDPIDPPRELLGGRSAEIVLTAEWHKRSAPELGLPVHDAGDPLPDGVEERPAFYLPEERFLWLPAYNALVCGDSLPDGGGVPDEWLSETPRKEYNEKLKPLLDLPIELLLPTHGDPVVEDAHSHLARALA
jgi:hypothetical protein